MIRVGLVVEDAIDGCGSRWTSAGSDVGKEHAERVAGFEKPCPREAADDFTALGLRRAEEVRVEPGRGQSVESAHGLHVGVDESARIDPEALARAKPAGV